MKRQATTRHQTKTSVFIQQPRLAGGIHAGGHDRSQYVLVQPAWVWRRRNSASEMR
jgi:hypothetical protein